MRSKAQTLVRNQIPASTVSTYVRTSNPILNPLPKIAFTNLYIASLQRLAAALPELLPRIIPEQPATLLDGSCTRRSGTLPRL